MKRILFTVMSLLMAGLLSAQSLSDLTPEQLEMYKKYKQGSSVSTNVVENGDPERKFDDNQYTKKKTTDDSDLLDEQILTKEKKIKGKTIYNEFIVDSLDTDKRLKEETDEQQFNKFLTKKVTLPLEVFGSKLFKTQNLTFEPKLNIPTPPRYILGTYDELIVDISGLYEANYRVKVSPEGFIRIPTAGQVKVGGLTVEAAYWNIKNRLAKIYSGVNTGETQVTVTLGNIRSIRVTVIGEAFRPGSYTLPSLATAFNALYACGGPGKMGSMRDIKVLRHGRVIATIDMYRFLIDGVMTDNVALQDEDVIKVEPYKSRVTIDGAIKHPAIFEALPGEKMKDLVRYAGGFTENAYKTKITGYRISGAEKSVVDVLEKEMSAFALHSGDVFKVDTTTNIFTNRVDISGSVFHPGAYALQPGMTVKQLITKADGLRNEAYLNMAFIYRKQKDMVPEVLSFNLGEVIHDVAPDILLQKNDSVRISSLFDYREKEMVSIWGSVKRPGIYKLVENITIKDLLFQAKGFTEMASTDSVELIRIIKDPKQLIETNVKTIVMKFKLDKDLNFQNGEGDFNLQNGDQVIVRNVSGYEGIRMVRIDGEVLQPGKYNITNKAERISDLVRRAGGFTNYAYPLGAYLVRNEKTSGVENILRQKMVDNAKRQIQSQSAKNIDVEMLKETGTTDIETAKEKLSGSKSAEQILETEGIVGINLQEIMTHPGVRQDLYLEEGDVIYVPRELQTVRVLGEVLFPTYVGYDKKMSLKDYVSGAGGFSDQAKTSRTFVLYANGTARSTKCFLGIKNYPTVRPGSLIVVPEKPSELKSRMSTAETVSILGSIATVATLIISVFR